VVGKNLYGKNPTTPKGGLMIRSFGMNWSERGGTEAIKSKIHNKYLK